MSNQVLILGGRGRIGSSVARDLLTHTAAQITVTGRQASVPGRATPFQPEGRVRFLSLDLADRETVTQAIAALGDCPAGDSPNLVIHCAGPFHYRDDAVLQLCLQHGVNYLDVCDHGGYTRQALTYREAANAAGVTAVINSGIFPGISNSMARQAVEQFDQADQIHIGYGVAGSGGAGLTVMRTTFLGLLHPFNAWIDGRWQQVQPYSDRQPMPFPPPLGTVYGHRYEMPEAITLPQSFAVSTVETRFGSIPDLYNHLTWMMARWVPKALLRQPVAIEMLSQVSYQMTALSDRFSGIGVGIRVEVNGQRDGQPRRWVATLVHDNTAIAAGCGTGSLAALLLSGHLHQPGVWPVEQILPTPLFVAAMEQRGMQIQIEDFAVL